MFQIDLKSRKPIYEQIMANFKLLAATGVLRENDKAPSVRDLAKTLTVNPNTIQKAYRELESQGWFYTVPGQGSFIAAPPKETNQKEINRLYGELEQTVRELLFFGVPSADIIKIIEENRQ